MAKPRPDEEMKMVVFKIPKSIFEQLKAIGKKEISDSGLPYSSVPLFCRKLVFEGLRKHQKKK